MPRKAKTGTGSKLKPAIRAILERTRKARLELDAFIKEPHGSTEEASAPAECATPDPAPVAARVVARRKAPQLGNGQPKQPPSDLVVVARKRDNRGSAPKVSDGNHRNARSGKGSVQPLMEIVALFKTGLTIDDVLKVHPDVSKGSLVAIKANVTRGAYK